MTIKRFHIKGDHFGSQNGYEIITPAGTIIRGSWKTGEREIIRDKFSDTLT